jgi:hypothetical protein
MKKITLILILILLIVACGEAETPTPTTTPTQEAVAVANTPTALPPTATSTPTATATTPPTATATPVLPAFSIPDQPLTDNGELTIEAVTLPEAGWIVVGSSDGERLGVLAVNAGISTNLTLTLDPFLATPDLIATLHADNGATGTFEPDLDTQLAETTFAVAIDIPLPSVLVSDQTVWEDGLLVIDSVQVFEPSWLVVSNVADPDVVLGVSPVTAGSHENVVVKVPWLETDLDVQVMVALDRGIAGIYEPTTTDTPTLAAGNPIVTQFRLTLPPDIFVLDQPVVGNKIVVERVTTDRDGWLVIYLDNNGTVGNIIGSALLQAGVNERVVVDLVAVPTPIVYARIHEETGVLGEFEFPVEDVARVYTDQFGLRYFTQVPIVTNAGISYIIADQPATDSITVDTLITNTPLWAVVRADNDGEMGVVLGRTKLPAGYHWDVTIAIDTEQITDTLYLALYSDRGEADVFEFPNGADIILIQNAQPVFTPFSVLP